ncbi:putative peptidase family-domain-containing protein [Chaetomium fimeti]|uniref:Peptidase family-domain-containing protein n=1 Tax=Chaetomium fimeti TaxID=1854472 RepID=A0AAE0H786_9PEZI|nr:putative peptidase family-domain-containing protein [Chaetomium fimeti]
MIQLDNFPTGEDGSEVTEVYQRCVLVSGRCNTKSAQAQNDSHVLVETSDGFDKTLFPEQRWPMCHGHFKALLLLSPGLNKISITAEDAVRTETPPLHLAIMIAKDSPLLIDCPPVKFGGLSSAHSSLDAAIAKFRMSAYMWQALTAEDLRAQGLGRRSFRLEEEWSTDTLSQRSQQTPTAGTVPKVHLIRTEKTVAELRDANLAQQNPQARRPDDLHTIFTNALLAHGGPFTTQNRPIVAGLILDSHYDAAGSASPTTDSNNKPLILAHAALGSHDPRGLSLGMFGSHLTYAWPRFLDEVPACLLDRAAPGDTVGNDNGQCNALWQACAVGQGAFLHEAGIAKMVFFEEGKEEYRDEETASVSNPVKSVRYSHAELKSRFGSGTLKLEITGMNGKQHSVGNIWKLFRSRTSVLVPGTNIRLLKQCVSGDSSGDDDSNSWTWAVMLKKRDSKGNLVAASKIDIRVGCGLDGAVVYYADGTKIPCGPRGRDGNDPSMGGHQARKLALPRNVEISKVAVTRQGIPPLNHKIIGFHGISGKWGMCSSFGIVTAPRDADLPDSVYDMEELQNNPDQDQHRNKKRRVHEEKEDSDDEHMSNSDQCDKDTDNSCGSEDEDHGYDDGSDSEMEKIYRN